MWVPPCDCGVKPMPPKPASRPECISTRTTSADEISTWVTAKNGTIAARIVPAVPWPPWPPRRMPAPRSSIFSSPATTGSSKACRSTRCARATRRRSRRPGGRARGDRASARRDQARRSREAAARTRSSSTRSACRLTSCASAARRAARLGRGSCAAASSPAAHRIVVGRVDEDAGSRRHELRRPADARRDDRSSRREALERGEPERLDEARLADDVGGGDPGGDPRMIDVAGELDASAAPRARPAADRRRGTSSSPSPRSSNARASRSTFLRSLSEPTQRNPVPCGDQPTSARAAAASRGANSSRSTPQSITELLASAAGTTSTSRPSSQADTATTACARRTVSCVAARTARLRRAFSTSCPWAVTTSGARPARAASRPAGTRKCA